MFERLVCEGTHTIDLLDRENTLERQNDIEFLIITRAGGGRESDLRSFVVDLTTKDRYPSVASIPNVLHQGLLDKVSIDADAP